MGDKRDNRENHRQRVSGAAAAGGNLSSSIQQQQYPPVTLIARLVQKNFFTTMTQDGRLLTKCGLTFLDLSGRSLDADIWSQGDFQKAQHLYRKLKPNTDYQLQNCSKFIPTDKKFSNSLFKIANLRNFWIDPHVDEVFNPRNYIPCTTSVNEAARQIEERGTANLMATYIARHPGPRKFLPGTRDLIARGHIVEFEDKNATIFYVLLWQPKNIKAPYPLFGAASGEIMLIPSCRKFTRPVETSPFVKDTKAIHLTTLCQTVSNSLAVAPEKFQELRRKQPRRSNGPVGQETGSNGAGDTHGGSATGRSRSSRQSRGFRSYNQ